MRKGKTTRTSSDNDTREITGVHDISGTIYREVGPSFKKVLGTDTDLDGSEYAEFGTEVPENRTPNLGGRGWCNRKTRVNVSKSSYRNQSDWYRKNWIDSAGGFGQYAPVCRIFVKSRFRCFEKVPMLLAHMEERDAYQHHLLENLNLVLESTGHAAANIMHAGPHNHDRRHHESLSNASASA